MKILGPIPDHIKRLMPAEARASLGKAGETMAETVAVADQKAELDLQSDIAGYLRLHDIPYILPNGRKKSPLPVGWPDFTFCYCGVFVAMEVKTPIGRLSGEQVAMHDKLKAQGGRIVVVRSLPEVQTLLRAIDQEIQGRRIAA